MSGSAMVYRSHQDLLERLKEALRVYYAQQRLLPPRITVHTTLVVAAQAALNELDVFTVAVEGLGGCLTPEVWLWLPAEEDEGHPVGEES